MTTKTITLQIPENIYTRLQQAAQATRRTLDEVVLHAVQVGSPPRWDDAPASYQADLAALDRLDDDTLWPVVRRRTSAETMARYQELLDKNAEETLTAAEREDLTRLRMEAERLMLCKAHAAALLRWRGYAVFENLCLACARCNEFKGSATMGSDLLTAKRWLCLTLVLNVGKNILPGMPGECIWWASRRPGAPLSWP